MSRKGNVLYFACSSQKVKLCEGGGETAGEEREEAFAAAGAKGEESTGTGEEHQPILKAHVTERVRVHY